MHAHAWHTMAWHGLLHPHQVGWAARVLCSGSGSPPAFQRICNLCRCCMWMVLQAGLLCNEVDAACLDCVWVVVQVGAASLAGWPNA